MKRNNTFMWAYIATICISVVMRFFVDYSMWNAVVLAIVISGVFFAMEDMFATSCRSLDEVCNLIDFYIREIRKSCDTYIHFHTEIKEIIDHYTGRVDSAVHIRLNREMEIQKAKDKVQDTLKSIEDMEKDNHKYKDKMLLFKIFESFLAFFGFFSIFIILFFYPYLSFSVFLQEIVTVFSFALILITQQMNLIIRKKNRKLLQNTLSELTDRAECYKEILRLEKEYYLINNGASIFDLPEKKVEAKDNAD